jgi:predicted signal transduction protein with EAL and GGDEF domain
MLPAIIARSVRTLKLSAYGATVTKSRTLVYMNIYIYCFVYLRSTEQERTSMLLGVALVKVIALTHDAFLLYLLFRMRHKTVGY